MVTEFDKQFGSEESKDKLSENKMNDEDKQ